MSEYWGTKGTANVKLICEEKPEGHLKTSSNIEFPGCFVKNDYSLQCFIHRKLDAAAVDVKKFDPEISKYIFYSPFESFKGVVTKAIIFYEKISTSRITKVQEQTRRICELKKPMVITFNGHFFLCCDSKNINECKFLEEQSKEVRIDQTLNPNKSFYGLGIEKGNLQFISFNMSQSQNDVYKVKLRSNFDKLKVAGPLLLDDNKTVVGWYEKQGNCRIKTYIFGKRQGDPPAGPPERYPAAVLPAPGPPERDQASALPPHGPPERDEASALPALLPSERDQASALPPHGPPERERASALPAPLPPERDRASALPPHGPQERDEASALTEPLPPERDQASALQPHGPQERDQASALPPHGSQERDQASALPALHPSERDQASSLQPPGSPERERASALPAPLPPERERASALPATLPPERDQASALPPPGPPEKKRASALPAPGAPERDQASALPSHGPPERERASALPPHGPPEKKRASALPAPGPPERDQASALPSHGPPERDQASALPPHGPPERERASALPPPGPPERDQASALPTTLPPERDRASALPASHSLFGDKTFLYDQLRFDTIRYLDDYSSGRGTLAELKERFRTPLFKIRENERKEIDTVRKLVEVLEEQGVIGPNNLKYLKMLAERLELLDLKQKVENVEAHCSIDNAIHVKTVLLVLGTELAFVSAALIYMYRNPKNMGNLQLFTDFGLQIFALFRGSVVFVLKVSSISSLKRLWQSYKDGSLKEKLTKAFNEMKELKEASQGEAIDVEVTIDGEEYREVLYDLILLEVKGESVKNTKHQRRHSICCVRDVPEDSSQPRVLKGESVKNTKRQHRYLVRCERNVPEDRSEPMDETPLRVEGSVTKFQSKTKGMAINNSADQPLTLGTLYRQDMETANILPYYPNPYHSLLENDTQYRIYRKNNIVPYPLLYPGRICSVAGNEFPVLMLNSPRNDIMKHWETCLPEFPKPVLKSIDEGIEDQGPIFTVFPMQRIPREKHAIDPDTHYHILLKSAIPKTGAPCPKHYTQDNVVFPCIVKADQGLGGYGNYECNDQEELKESLKEIKGDFGEDATYVITEFVDKVEETLECQFYLNRKGEVHWLGTNVSIVEQFTWVGSEMDWDLGGVQKDLVYESFIVPVADYLHNKGYFGITGIDIICSPSGNYLVDINPRITAFTPHVLIAPVMARKGLTKSLFKSGVKHSCTTKELIKTVDSVNRDETKEGKIIILSSMDVGFGCIASLVVFAKTKTIVEKLFNDLNQLEGMTPHTEELNRDLKHQDGRHETVTSKSERKLGQVTASVLTWIAIEQYYDVYLS